MTIVAAELAGKIESTSKERMTGQKLVETTKKEKRVQYNTL
jgi:hypothetical protein